MFELFKNPFDFSQYHPAKARLIDLPASVITIAAGALVLFSGGTLPMALAGAGAIGAGVYSRVKHMDILQGKQLINEKESLKKSGYGMRVAKSLFFNLPDVAMNAGVAVTGLALVMPAVLFGLTATPAVAVAAVVGAAMAATGTLKTGWNTLKIAAAVVGLGGPKKEKAPKAPKAPKGKKAKAETAAPSVAAAPADGFDAALKGDFDASAVKGPANDDTPETKAELKVQPPKPPGA